MGRRRAADAAAPPPAAPVGRRRRAPPDGPAVSRRPTTRGSSSGRGPRSRASRSTRTSSPASRPRTTPRTSGRSRSSAALDPAGLHVFRYSARPGTPATRMAGQVDERTKKARAADLLALAADAKARVRAAAARDGDAGARSSSGSPTGAGSATPRTTSSSRWPRAPAIRADLENAILTVRRTAVDGEVADRVTGEILAIDPAPRTLARGAARRSPAAVPEEAPMPADCLFCRIVAGRDPGDPPPRGRPRHRDPRHQPAGAHPRPRAARPTSPRPPTSRTPDGPLLGRLFAVAATLARARASTAAGGSSRNVGERRRARPSTTSTSICSVAGR